MTRSDVVKATTSVGSEDRRTAAEEGLGASGSTVRLPGSAMRRGGVSRDERLLGSRLDGPRATGATHRRDGLGRG